jgi:D-glycero-alpha-D-manno-heptose-7-phosphate kinase
MTGNVVGPAAWLARRIPSLPLMAGSIAIRMGGEVRVSPLTLHPRSASWIDNNLLLFDTGTSRDASQVVAMAKLDADRQTEKGGFGRPSRRIEQLHGIRALVAPFRQAVAEGCVDRFGPLLTENWALKSGLGRGISTPRAEELLSGCLAAGAHGGKLVGAGGGGYVLVSVPDRVLSAVRRAMARAQAPELPFRLSRRGARAEATGTCGPAARTSGEHRVVSTPPAVHPLAGEKELS